MIPHLAEDNREEKNSRIEDREADAAPEVKEPAQAPEADEKAPKQADEDAADGS